MTSEVNENLTGVNWGPEYNLCKISAQSIQPFLSKEQKTVQNFF